MLSLHFGKGESFARFHCLDDGEEENDDRGYLFSKKKRLLYPHDMLAAIEIAAQGKIKIVQFEQHLVSSYRVFFY